MNEFRIEEGAGKDELSRRVLAVICDGDTSAARTALRLGVMPSCMGDTLPGVGRGDSIALQEAAHQQINGQWGVRSAGAAKGDEPNSISNPQLNSVDSSSTSFSPLSLRFLS